jgi:predicted Zn-dependent protease
MPCIGAARLRGALTLAAAVAALSCAVNPATGSRELSFVSEAREIQMGRSSTKDVAASIGIYADSNLERWMQAFGAELAARSERPALPWSFQIVDDPAVNAFALPGGFIYVTRGILAHLNSDAELAGVVGHEIGHVTARHAVRRLTKQQLATFGLVAGAIARPDLARYSDLASSALGIVFLKYSRDDERQADDLGLRYVRRAGYDARQMPNVFEVLERVSATAGGGRVPEWLATHPNPGNRRERISAALQALPPESLGTRLNRDGYLRRLEGLVFGADPRQGYVKGSRFLHPALRFQMVFPDGWTTSNQRQAVIAMPAAKDAMVELTVANERTAELAMRAFLSQGDIVSGVPSAMRVNGLPAVSAGFAAGTESGTLRGLVVCLEYEQLVYRLTAYAPPLAWLSYESAAQRAVGSFAPLSDSVALRVQPQRLSIIIWPRRASIGQLSEERASPVPPATLALLNQVEVDTPIAAGALIKWVVGQAAP